MLQCFLDQNLIPATHLIFLPVETRTEAGSTQASNTTALQCLSERISGAGFLLLSGIGTGSFGRRLSFLVIMGFTSMESVKEQSWRADKARRKSREKQQLSTQGTKEITFPLSYRKLDF